MKPDLKIRMTKSQITNPNFSRWSLRFVIWNLVLVFWCFFVYACSYRDPKLQQYFAQGQVLYEKNCSNCHQKNGKGLGRVYPPLASSDFLNNNFEKSFCLMKYGIQGEITVNGQSFNKAMPAIPSLTELEIAEIATYIGNSWGHEKGLIDVTQTSKILKGCAQ